MNERRARIAVIGTGWWPVEVHLPALRDNPDADLVAVCDRDRARADHIAARFGAPYALSGMDELLGLGLDLDAVLVATPPDEHHPPAAAALDAGVDVLVEKPLALRSGEAWDLVRRAREGGAHLHVGYSYPYSPHAARLRAALQGGELGPLVMVSALFATASPDFHGTKGAAGSQAAYADPHRGGGQLHTQLTQAVSLALWLTGLRPDTVTAHAYLHDAAVDVADTLSVSFNGGAVASFATTGTVHLRDQRFEEYRFFGSDGHAELDTRHGVLEISRRGEQPEPAPVLTQEAANPLTAPSAALVATALDSEPVVVSGELGARTADVLAAATHSIKTGEMVSVGSV